MYELGSVVGGGGGGFVIFLESLVRKSAHSPLECCHVLNGHYIAKTNSPGSFVIESAKPSSMMRFRTLTSTSGKGSSVK